jgi:hypothetical protein
MYAKELLIVNKTEFTIKMQDEIFNSIKALHESSDA